MAQRVFRLSISPEDLPEVRRVIDFDGRSSLADVHAQIRATYGLSAGSPLYGFFMSGRFWDAKSAYLDPRTDGERADKALLFRLGLAEGQTFAYLLDFGAEQRFVITVTSVRDVAQPLAQPTLLESVGEAPPVAAAPEAPQADPPELVELVPLAEAFLDADEELDEFEAELNEPESDTDLSHVVPGVRRSMEAAQTLVQALAGSLQRFLALDEWLLERSLGTRLLDLPFTSARVGEFDAALQLARSLVFVDRELMEGDIAVILARAGRGPEALAQLDSNLSHAQDAALVELKAGDTHHALGDLAAAEAYYRRSLEVSKAPAARYEARLRLVDCLIDAGRTVEADQLLKEARQAVGETETAPVPVVGRNDPCPCGSGKKYKKCHGANG